MKQKTILLLAIILLANISFVYSQPKPEELRKGETEKHEEGNNLERKPVGSQFTVLKTGEGKIEGNVVVSGDMLYGTSNYGGTDNREGIFSMRTDGSNFKMLRYQDDYDVGDYEGLTLIGNTLFGVVNTDRGYLFSIDTNGSNYKVLWNFGKYQNLRNKKTNVIENVFDGYSPTGVLTTDGNRLFGTTESGGKFGNGIIFTMDIDGSNYMILHNFDDLNGGAPQSGLILVGDTLYGSAGGGLGSGGVIFSMQTNGLNFKKIADTDVQGGLCYFNGNLFGVSPVGKYHRGSVFSIKTNGTNLRSLYDFNGTYQFNPCGPLTIVDSTIFGMTKNGGTSNAGIIYSVNLNGTNFKTLHEFDYITCRNPSWGLTYYKGVLYGTTSGDLAGAIISFSLVIPNRADDQDQEVIVVDGDQDGPDNAQEEVFAFAEQMPTFPEGEAAFKAYIHNNMRYPQAEKDMGKEGTVWIYFEVGKDGSIGNVQTRKGVPGAPGLQTEAERLIKSMPRWNPGKLNGRPVAVSMTVPVKFVLQ